MILQALRGYYERRNADADPARRLPAFGLERKEIAFILELSADGRLVAIVDTRRIDGKRQVGTAYLVPKAVKRASGIAANLLWDNAEYVLGLADPKKRLTAEDKGKAEDYAARLRDTQAAFRQRIEALPAAAQADAGIRAVLGFLRGEAARDATAFVAADELSGGAALSFRLVDDPGLLISQRPAVALHVVAQDDGAESEDGTEASDTEAAEASMCLVTGQVAPTERLHSAIKGVWGAQSSGANIVSFNLDAFVSHGRTQGSNAPVSRAAAFAYTTALNALLARDSVQRVQVGDASTVFWAQQTDAVEDELALIFGAAGDDPDDRAAEVRALYESIRSGAFDGARGDNLFYVLGLAPNAARIAVRFWHAGPLRELAQRIRQWFDDLAITRAPHDPQHPTLFALLVATAVQGKADNVAPHLAGDLMHSLLEGLPLPDTALQAVIQRCRAEQAKKSDTGKPVPHVSYARAALMKTCINRLVRAGRLDGKEITVDLDEGSPDAAYQLGRLFAVYERIQSDAAGRDLNRSIRDAYFGSAMSNPATAFPRLVQLNQVHMRDLRRSAPGLHVVRDRLLGEIWGRLSPDYRFPVNQPLAERARFALGYYHQRQAFFTKAGDTPGSDQPEGNA